MPHPLK